MSPPSQATPAGAQEQTTQVGIGWRQPHYTQLLDERPALDFLEVHSENFFAAGGAAMRVLERGRSHYPVSLHGVGLSLGSAQRLDPWHLDRLARLVQGIDPVRVSDHACFARATYQGATVHAADLLPLPFSPEALDALCANVQQVQERLRRRFMVENLSAYVQWQACDESTLTEPAFLNGLAQRTGCALLIDVNNIYVNALNAHAAGQCADPLASCRDWLQQIQPHSVGELHLGGHCHVSDAFGNIVVDDHGSRVCPAVWALYRHALECFGAIPTLVEWDTDIPALEVLLDEVARARALAQQTLGVGA